MCCIVTSPPFDIKETETIEKDELLDKTRLISLKQCLNKNTIELMLDSDTQWLVIDLCDMQMDFAIYKKYIFATQAHEFCNTKLFRKYSKDIVFANFMQLPEWLWYGYVDVFFDKISEKYDSEHIIFNRFRSNTYYLSEKGTIEFIPDIFKNGYQPNDKYN